jgi:FkbM family methyltransferase
MDANEQLRDGMGEERRLVSMIKSIPLLEPGSGSSTELARALSGRLGVASSSIIKELQQDQDATLAAIRILTRTGMTEAAFALVSRLVIAGSDAALQKAAVETVLGGRAETTHSWILGDNILRQRLDMINTVVLPYVATACPQKNLFLSLKQYEADTLALNRPLLDPEAICNVIAAARNGFDMDRLPRPALGPTDPEGSIRLVLPSQTFSILLRLAWVAQEYLFALHERYGPQEFISTVEALERVIPVYLIPTHLGYPMGGGESFMHQTCRILSEFGVRCIWVSFLDPKLGWYTEELVAQTPYYLDVRYAGGCSKEAVLRAVEQYTPDLMHAQGGTNDIAMEIAQQSRLTTLIGYHFWHGLIELGDAGNRHIMQHLSEHRLRIAPFQQSKHIRKYVASEFMKDVYARLDGNEEIQVLHPISDAAQFLAERDDLGTYVLQINVCVHKGGRIFLESVKALGDRIPFMGIESEPEQTDFVTRLKAEMDRYPLCVLRSYGSVRDFFRVARMVIVPTLVDETFCRVAFEAAMNGIPVLTTSNGFLPYMFGDSGVFLAEDPARWIETIRELYHDEARLKEIGAAQKARLQSAFGGNSFDFITNSLHLIDDAATRNVGIFSAWADQGLGNLCHTYSKLLRSVGYKVHVFSFQPYSAAGKALLAQTDSDDWGVPGSATSVYYSFNSREEVTVYELTQFILANDVHTLLVPEICWTPNWERLFALRVDNLTICAIPMAEIVIKDEIPYHNRLSSTLYCTRLAERVLTEAGVHNGAFLGHGFGQPLSHDRVEAKRRRLASRERIRYLHVAGHNPNHRKNTSQVIDAFRKALLSRNDIELTVTSMDPVSTYYQGPIPDRINILDRRISRAEILDLYESHDVSIQVPSHEGLGLGFYEATSRCTPIISLDAAPHDEVVSEGVTGWLLPAQPVPVVDNERSIVSSWRFDTAVLTDRIVSLTREAIEQTIISTEHAFRTRFDETALLTRLLQVLPRKHVREATQPGVDDDKSRIIPNIGDEISSPLPEAPGGRRAIHLVKRGAHAVLRRVYRLARPITRRVAYRLHLIVADAIAGLRDDLLRQVGALVQEVRASRPVSGTAQGEHDASISLARRLEESMASVQAALRRIESGNRFIKNRIASYAGAGVVLTYLRDESPIFVNTGDLGCPSPIINGGVWEPENLQVLYSFLRPETVFLDIGANVGYFAIALANRLGPGGHVLAFEPHPDLVGLMERSIQLNGLENVVKVHQCAVSDHDGMVQLFYPDAHLGQGSISRAAAVPGRTLSVQARRLDDFLPQDMTVDLVKIDVEGHELGVLQGMRNVLLRSQDVKMLFEKLEVAAERDPVGELLGELHMVLYGVGAHATLVPLNREQYRTWVGDVLAVRGASPDRLQRTGFCVYPGQLIGRGVELGTATRYSSQHGGLVFSGPDWYLPRGQWTLRLHGSLRGIVRLVIVDDGATVLAEVTLSEFRLSGAFAVDHDITHFEVQAYAEAGTEVGLVRLQFEQT